MALSNNGLFGAMQAKNPYPQLKLSDELPCAPSQEWVSAHRSVYLDQSQVYKANFGVCSTRLFPTFRCRHRELPCRCGAGCEESKAMNFGRFRRDEAALIRSARSALDLPPARRAALFRPARPNPRGPHTPPSPALDHLQSPTCRGVEPAIQTSTQPIR